MTNQFLLDMKKSHCLSRQNLLAFTRKINHATALSLEYEISILKLFWMEFYRLATSIIKRDKVIFFRAHLVRFLWSGSL